MATYDFSGKYFLVSGATGAIGSQLCRDLKKSNARFFVCGRDSVKLENLKTELQCEGALIDGASFSSYEDAVSKALIHGNLSGAVCCTGSVILKSAHATSQQEFDATMSANATSAFGLTRAAAKAMSNSGGGSIVLVASAAAQIGLQNHEAIAAAKGAVMGLTLSAAATYARSQIRVNCVSPGLTETPLTARITANEASRKASEAMHPLGRLGKPEDIVASMMWLLSDDASWVTGQVLGVDGGLGSLKVRI
jgi:NAD(P)-dependent dehydrogenase (short-subunit alcohol dehydrogenase family)